MFNRIITYEFSSARLMAVFSSLVLPGFKSSSRIPLDFAFSSSMASLKPVQRMTGMSGRFYIDFKGLILLKMREVLSVTSLYIKEGYFS
jgi:hypothetical protein